MSLLTQFADFLKAPVGNNLENRPEDILSTKRKLRQAGFYDDDNDNEFITRALDTSIRGFQRERGLVEDGRMYPAGETERSLFERITGQLSDTVFGKANDDDNSGTIGFGGNISGTFERPSTPPFMPEYEEKSRRDQPLRPIGLFSGLSHLFDVADSRPSTRIYLSDNGDVPISKTDMLSLAQEEGRQDKKEEAAKKETRSEPVEEKAIPMIVVRPPILKGHDDEVVKDEIRKHENTIHYMYKDTAEGGGKVTIGTGHLLNSLEKALALPFKVKDADGTERDATKKEIQQAYEKVNDVKQPADNKQAHPAEAFDPKGESSLAEKRGFDDLYLSKEDEKKVFEADLREHAKLLRRDLPNINEFPPEAQLGLLDMKFNTNLDFDEKWPKLKIAIDNGDWGEAAKEVNRVGISDERNIWTRQKMLDAEQWVKKNRTKK